MVKYSLCNFSSATKFLMPFIQKKGRNSSNDDLYGTIIMRLQSLQDICRSEVGRNEILLVELPSTSWLGSVSHQEKQTVYTSLQLQTSELRFTPFCNK